MIDPVSVASGMIAGIASTETSHAVHGAFDSDEQKRLARRLEFHDFLQRLDEMTEHLENILNSLSRQYSPDEWYAFQTQPDPNAFIVPAYTRNHFNMFIAGSTAIMLNFRIPNLGLYSKTVGPGWIQVDLPEHTEITSGDAVNHYVAVVFSDEERGPAI